ncbi:MAG: alpha/beta hydrolase [Actinobacteria bacterium]|nr:alpha/beta hydrolase [Actinomycetota bacterium]
MNAELPTSQWVDLDGPVHWIDFGGPDDGPLLVCVHGLGGSHVNWAAVAPDLAKTCRVVALDLAGFGHTPGAGRSTSVQANARLVVRFLEEVAGAPAVLVGNSMGGLISNLVAAQRPDLVAGLVLVDPALPVSLRAKPDPLTTGMFAAYFTPGLGKAVIAGRKRVRTAEQLAMDTLRLCCVDPSRVPKAVLREHIHLAKTRKQYAEMEAEFVTATRSLVWLLARRRAHTAMLRRYTGPVLLIHGDRDRLVSIASARAAAKANPAWRFEVAHDIGHVPQLEAPDWTRDVVLDWLATDGVSAADAARGAAQSPQLRSGRGAVQ